MAEGDGEMTPVALVGEEQIEEKIRPPHGRRSDAVHTSVADVIALD
jgi:hypothetical protein